MKCETNRSSLRFLVGGLLMLAACGGGSEAGLSPVEESLGTHEAAMCAGSNVTTLSITGASTYQGVMAGSGTWAVAYPANAVHLDYYVDGVLRSSDERTSASGTWYYSSAGFTCGISHTLQVRAIPMVIDSSGTRTVCWENTRSASQIVLESCPITAGNAHTMALKQDGTVWGWGWNGIGQLGDGTTLQRNTPVRAGINAPSAVVTFGNHTMAVKPDGTVWAWGLNEYGELGDGTTTQRNTPVQVPGISNVIAVATGVYHTVALKRDGTLWAWG
ncbi:RCC1 domain-containing protein, partial [Archangium sp.]|uniref:RCC1 domain-containing protein n=1 Tax=Archangium sp. TaxID=1872627 RepID=UPI002D7621BE|nr:RCC1 repeat-containing protein [Archangium sp.]